jgi:hypothetical protein
MITSTKWIGAALAIFVSLGAAHVQQLTAADSAQELSSVATEDLIAKLQDESNQGIGTHTTAWASGFMAINDEPKFNGGIMGSAKPVISPVMRELVHRGTTALPMLIDHLSDGRPTKLTVGKEFMGKWFSDEYDPRDHDPAKEPPGVTPASLSTSGGKKGKSFDTYTVKVGDLCFVAVGQIVNRQLNAVRYQPSMCLVVNSPVETHALAAAVKADWSGLTPADHQRSLEEDALHSSTYGQSPEAVKRLMFYYPESGAALAVRILNSPLCDTTLVLNFLEKRLLTAKDDQEQDRLMAEFRKENGEANYGDMQSCLIMLSTSSRAHMSADQTREKIASGKILSRAFPGVDSKHPSMSGGTDFQPLHDLVDALTTFASEAIDQAVYDLLKRTSETHPDNVESVYERCQLVHACTFRLTKPSEREELDKSYRQVMSYFPHPPDSALLTTFSQRFQVYLQSEIEQLAPR